MSESSDTTPTALPAPAYRAEKGLAPNPFEGPHARRMPGDYYRRDSAVPTFTTEYAAHRWDEVAAGIRDKTPEDVRRALLRHGRIDMEDFKALLSPAAAMFLEAMAHRSRALTAARFGRTMQLYAPLYLSNECNNICTYCGFSLTNRIPRRTLSAPEIAAEGRALKEQGFRHVLLVTGEAPRRVGLEYFRMALGVLRPLFAQISLEVQPLEEAEYAALAREGVHAVLVYQETYHREAYRRHHPKGKKSLFRYRLETPDRLGRAGIHKIGLGFLAGLANWRADAWFTGLHLRWLARRHWRSRTSLSFPRLRPAAGAANAAADMTRRELAQLICAYRLLDPDVELSLSTRESPHFRDHAARLGITTMSAGSRTNPGGYAVEPETLEQFSVSDERPPAEVAAGLQSAGFDPVWKDWDPALG